MMITWQTLALLGTMGWVLLGWLVAPLIVIEVARREARRPMARPARHVKPAAWR